MTNNFILKFNNYFILFTFLISIVSIQFGFLDSLNLFYLSSINLFLILILLICVSTKKIKKIIFPVILLSFLGCVYFSGDVIVLFVSYLITALIIFYLNRGPLFISDNFKLSMLCCVSVITFKITFFLFDYLFNLIFYKQNILSININFIVPVLFQILYSIVILFLFKPDIKYINYEFLVGD